MTETHNFATYFFFKKKYKIQVKKRRILFDIINLFCFINNYINLSQPHFDSKMEMLLVKSYLRHEVIQF